VLTFRGANQWATPISLDSLMNKWTHVVAVYNGGDKSTPSSFAVYFDGVRLPQGSVNLGWVGGDANDNVLGSDQFPGSHFLGQIDEPQIIGHALSASEVASLYAFGTVGLAAAISADGPTTFCAGAGVTLDAGAGYAIYLWSTGKRPRRSP